MKSFFSVYIRTWPWHFVYSEKTYSNSDFSSWHCRKNNFFKGEIERERERNGKSWKMENSLAQLQKAMKIFFPKFILIAKFSEQWPWANVLSWKFWIVQSKTWHKNFKKVANCIKKSIIQSKLMVESDEERIKW